MTLYKRDLTIKLHAKYRKFHAHAQSLHFFWLRFMRKSQLKKRCILNLIYGIRTKAILPSSSVVASKMLEKGPWETVNAAT